MAVSTTSQRASGSVVVLGGCVLGFAAGGFADGLLLGHDDWFGRFGAAFGLCAGGGLAAAYVEVVAPLTVGFHAFFASDVPVPPAPLPAAPPGVAETEKLNLAGRAARNAGLLLGLALGAALLAFLARPLAMAAGMPLAAAGLLLLVPAALLAVAGTWVGLQFAHEFDLVREAARPAIGDGRR